MVLRKAREKQTCDLILKMFFLEPKSDVWDMWEPQAVKKFNEEIS